MVLFGVGLAVGPDALSVVAEAVDLNPIGGRGGLDSFDLHSRKGIGQFILEGQGSASETTLSAELNFDLFRHLIINLSI